MTTGPKSGPFGPLFFSMSDFGPLWKVVRFTGPLFQSLVRFWSAFKVRWPYRKRWKIHIILHVAYLLAASKRFKRHEFYRIRCIMLCFPWPIHGCFEFAPKCVRVWKETYTKSMYVYFGCSRISLRWNFSLPKLDIWFVFSSYKKHLSNFYYQKFVVPFCSAF